MEAIEHLAISAIVSPVAVYLFFGELAIPVFTALAVYGVAAGVLIDLDHFVIARFRTGSWRYLLEAIKNPLTITTDNQKILEGAIPNRDRYVSHFAILATAPAAAYAFSPPLAYLTFTMLGGHVAADVYASLKNRGNN